MCSYATFTSHTWVFFFLSPFFFQDVTTILTACQQELNEALKEISKMSSVDNRGPLENLYTLKFPNCDRHGLYNRKQVNA